MSACVINNRKHTVAGELNETGHKQVSCGVEEFSAGPGDKKDLQSCSCVQNNRSV